MYILDRLGQSGVKVGDIKNWNATWPSPCSVKFMVGTVRDEHEEGKGDRSGLDALYVEIRLLSGERLEFAHRWEIGLSPFVNDEDDE